MTEINNFLRKYKFPLIVILIFIILTCIIIYKSEDFWSANTLSLIGSLASVLGLLIVIQQLMELAENTDELKSRTEELSETYSAAIYSLVNSDTIFKISKANEKITVLKKLFNEDSIENSGEHFDFLFATLTELDQYTTLNGFEGKIDGNQLTDFIGFCTEMTARIYSVEDVTKANLKEEYRKLYEMESFLIATNNNLRLNQ